MPMFVFGLMWLLIIGGILYFAVRVVRSLEGSRLRVQDEIGVGKRMQLLEETIERQSAEIEQLVENQRFLESLLKSKSPLPSDSNGSDNR